MVEVIDNVYIFWSKKNREYFLKRFLAGIGKGLYAFLAEHEKDVELLAMQALSIPSDNCFDSVVALLQKYRNNRDDTKVLAQVKAKIKLFEEAMG